MAESLGHGRIGDEVVAFKCDVEEDDGLRDLEVFEGPGADRVTATPTELDARVLNVTRDGNG
eukprot:2402983-Pyramimonas_sp.AAC.1